MVAVHISFVLFGILFYFLLLINIKVKSCEVTYCPIGSGVIRFLSYYKYMYCILSTVCSHITLINKSLTYLLNLLTKCWNWKNLSLIIFPANFNNNKVIWWPVICVKSIIDTLCMIWSSWVILGGLVRYEYFIHHRLYNCVM